VTDEGERRSAEGTPRRARRAWRSPGFVALAALLAFVASLVLVVGDDDGGDELAAGPVAAATGADDHDHGHDDRREHGHGEGDHVAGEHGDDHGDGQGHGQGDHGEHEGGAHGTTGHGHDAGGGHDHGAGDHAPGAGDHGDHAPGSGGPDHGHPPGGSPGHPHPPTPGPTCDLGQPVTIHGTFTPTQCSAAQKLIADVKRVLQTKGFADHRVAEAAGYASIRDHQFVVAGNGERYEHFVNWNYLSDSHVMNPDRVESLVYRIGPGGTKILESAMFILPLGQTMAHIPSLYASPLTPWHLHTNLCWDLTTPSPTIGGIKKKGQPCPSPLVDFPTPPMLHVWIVPTPCGPFAEVEGAAGDCGHISH
jgi:hypothetical protein